MRYSEWGDQTLTNNMVFIFIYKMIIYPTTCQRRQAVGSEWLDTLFHVFSLVLHIVLVDPCKNLDGLFSCRISDIVSLENTAPEYGRPSKQRPSRLERLCKSDELPL